MFRNTYVCLYVSFVLLWNNWKMKNQKYNCFCLRSCKKIMKQNILFLFGYLVIYLWFYLMKEMKYIYNANLNQLYMDNVKYFFKEIASTVNLSWRSCQTLYTYWFYDVSIIHIWNIMSVKCDYNCMKKTNNVWWKCSRDWWKCPPAIKNVT